MYRKEYRIGAFLISQVSLPVHFVAQKLNYFPATLLSECHSAKANLCLEKI